MALTILAATALLAWLYLLLAHGNYWTMRDRLPPPPQTPLTPTTPQTWPIVTAIIPARNEAEILPETLPSLLNQTYPGEFTIILVDDASTDNTAETAKKLAHEQNLTVVTGSGPPKGWTGKVAALATGTKEAGEKPDYLLFTDADIHHPPNSVQRLVESAQDRDLVSLMARLRTDTPWEKLIIPAFIYFFAQLYPFPWVNKGKTAAAAGGCVLIKRKTLQTAGGLEQIKSALIDDVALATLIKQQGGRTWLSLTTEVKSLRKYPKLKDLWDMIARSAYHQLRYSPTLLTGTIVGLMLIYAVPPTLTIAAAGTTAGWLATAAWAVMTITYLPILTAYRLKPWWAPLLPITAILYAAMTVDSAWRHVRGRGGAWKGRTAERGGAVPPSA